MKNPQQYYRKGKFGLEAVWKSRVSFLVWLEMFFFLFEHLMSLNPGWVWVGIRSLVLIEASLIKVPWFSFPWFIASVQKRNLKFFKSTDRSTGTTCLTGQHLHLSLVQVIWHF